MTTEERLRTIVEEVHDPVLRKEAIRAVLDMDARPNPAPISFLPETLRDLGIDPQGARRYLGYGLDFSTAAGYASAVVFCLSGVLGGLYGLTSGLLEGVLGGFVGMLFCLGMAAHLWAATRRLQGLRGRSCNPASHKGSGPAGIWAELGRQSARIPSAARIVGLVCLSAVGYALGAVGWCFIGGPLGTAAGLLGVILVVAVLLLVPSTRRVRC